MGRVSAAHSLIINASSTVLAAAAAGMSSGQWLQMTGGNLPSGLSSFVRSGGLYTAGSSGIATHFAQNMPYDPVGKKLYWLGCDHGSDTLFLTYDEASNAISEQVASVPWGIENGNTTSHGYCHSVWVTKNSKLWSRPYTALSMRRWDGGTTWGTVNYSGVFYGNPAIGCAYHPNIGANGAIIGAQVENGTSGTLWKIDPVTNVFSILIHENTGTLDPFGSKHNFAAYNPISDLVLFGGGDDSGGNRCWTIDASQTVTAKANTPAGLGANIGPATGLARIWPNPNTGGFIAIKDASTWYDFDPAANAWTARGGTVSMLSSNTFNGTIDGVIGEAIFAYGVIVFFKAYSADSPAQMWLFKP